MSQKHVNSKTKHIHSNSYLLIPIPIIKIIINALMLSLVHSNMLLHSFQKSKTNNHKIFLKKSVKSLKKFKTYSNPVEPKSLLSISIHPAHLDTPPHSIHPLSLISQSINSINSTLMISFKFFLDSNNHDHLILDSSKI